MGVLYNKKYLIAVYDAKDRLIDVGSSIDEITCMRPHYVYEKLSRQRDGIFRGPTIYLIDCLEQHDDIFKEEDDLFLQEIGYKTRLPKTQAYTELGKKLGVSLRTIHRWIKLGKLKGVENVIEKSTRDY